MPDFSGIEGSGREVALYRVLRGCGSQDSGFLDYAIALEAALLGGATTELAFRFSLNGAIYPRDERDATETFETEERLRRPVKVGSRGPDQPGQAHCSGARCGGTSPSGREKGNRDRVA